MYNNLVHHGRNIESPDQTTANGIHSLFRGRLMSLLVLTHSGVSPRPHLPQDKEGFDSDTSHAEKGVFFFKELAYSICWGKFSISTIRLIRFI